MSGSDSPPSTGSSDIFPKSRWTLIGQVQHGSETIARDAMNTLCGIYWFPIYAYVRRTGMPPAEAEDLTQGYFLDLLERGYIDKASREKGKFRAFLLTDLKHYLANERRRAQARKRGKGVQFIPIQAEWAEERYGIEPVEQVSPDHLYDRQWAITLLGRVMEALREEYQQKGRIAVFEALKQFISWNAGDESYSTAAEKLGRDVNYVKVNVLRLRQNYRKLLEAEVAHTVSSPEDIAAEIRYLAAAMC